MVNIFREERILTIGYNILRVIIKFSLSIKFSKFLPFIIFFSTLLSAEVCKSEINDPDLVKDKLISPSYLNSKNELEDYIIGIGDGLFIDFYPAIELSGIYQVNEEGEVYLPSLNEVNVNGLTTLELEKLLEKNYSDFLISPAIKVKIAIFKEIKVTVTGEVRYPGTYKFPSYESSSVSNFFGPQKPQEDFPKIDFEEENSQISKKFEKSNEARKNFQNQNYLNNQFAYKKDSKNTKNISDIIRKAGGITSLSDLTKIEIVREVPLGKGGGKKVALVNLNDFFNGNHIFLSL